MNPAQHPNSTQSPPPAYPGQQEYQTKQPGATHPQQPGYPVQQDNTSTTTTTVVYQQPPTILMGMQFNEYPVSMNCPHCQATIVTATDFTPGTLTWLSCGATALVGCWVGCCLIPFCVDALKDVIHSCPNCKNQVGVFRRM